MAKKHVSLDRLDERLRKVAEILDRCARLIVDLDLNTHQNLKRIGEALRRIFEIEGEIYELRPDLTPEYLTEEWIRAQRATRTPENELAFLRNEAEGYRRFLERAERRISELEETVKQDNKEGG